MVAGKIGFSMCLFALILTIAVHAQQAAAPKDADVAVLEFKDAEYPPIPRFRHTSGTVVVQAKLDDHGEVEDAAVISGQPDLALAAVVNVKKWRFRPNGKKSAVIVYNYVYLEGRCESNGSLFVLSPSNLATVYGCGAPPVAAP
jgi:TonB family protein